MYFEFNSLRTRIRFRQIIKPALIPSNKPSTLTTNGLKRRNIKSKRIFSYFLKGGSAEIFDKVVQLYNRCVLWVLFPRQAVRLAEERKREQSERRPAVSYTPRSGDWSAGRREEEGCALWW